VLAIVAPIATEAPAASSLLRGESPVLPWFIPGVAVSLAVSLVAGGRVARALDLRRALGSMLILGFGIIVSATLTPLRGSLDFDTVVRGSCDFSRLGLPPLSELRGMTDTSLNILLFIPLGFSVALLPRSRRAGAVIGGAMALPFAIEATQLLLPALSRGCESADVVDNVTGLVVGAAGGVVAGWIARAVHRRGR
jgi:VanZ family protein